MPVKRLPHVAMLGPIPPVAVDRGPWTLPLTHQKERTAIASPMLLWGVVEGEVPLESLGAGLGEVNTVFICPAAVAALAVAFHALDGARGVRIAGVPDARRLVVGAEQEVAHVLEDVEAQGGQLVLEREEAQERLNVLRGRESVLLTDGVVFDLEDVEARARHADA